MGTESLRLCQCLPCGGWVRSNTAAQTVDRELKHVLDNGVKEERDGESRWETLRRVLVAALYLAQFCLSYHVRIPLSDPSFQLR